MRRYGRWAAVGVVAVGVVAAGVANSRPPADPVVLTALKTSDTPRPEASVSLQWANPPELRVNRPAPYTLTATNTGSQPVQKVVVQVRVPAGVTAADTDPPAKAVGGVLLWELGTLDVAESRPLKMTLSSPTRGPLTAEAWVTFTGTAATTATVREPKLEAFIEVPESVEIGQPFAVKYRVKNAGDVLATGVNLETPRDRFPAFATGERGYQPAIQPGEEETRTAEHTATGGGVETFDLAVTASDGLNAKATAKVKVLAPKLEVGVTGPAEVGVGKAAEYRVTVTNAGDAPARGVELVTQLGAGLTRTDDTRYAGLFNDPAQWTDVPQGFDLKPGESKSFTMNGTASTPGVAAASVTATTKQGVKATAECRTVVKGVPGIRMEVIDTTDPLKVGDETTYEIKVTNTGTAADRNLTLVCDLPPGLTLVKATGPVPSLERLGVDFDRPGADKNVRTVTFDPVRDLGPKTEVVFQVTVKAEKSGTAKFKASITSDHLTTAVTKEESTTVYGD